MRMCALKWLLIKFGSYDFSHKHPNKSSLLHHQVTIADGTVKLILAVSQNCANSYSEKKGINDRQGSFEFEKNKAGQNETPKVSKTVACALD